MNKICAYTIQLILYSICNECLGECVERMHKTAGFILGILSLPTNLTKNVEVSYASQGIPHGMLRGFIKRKTANENGDSR